MPRKKTTVTEEEIEDAPQEIDYNKDIKGKSMKEVVEETPEKEEPKEEKEEVKEEEKAPEPEEKIDPKELAKEVADSAKEQLAEFLKGTNNKETEENVDEYEKFRAKFEKDEGKQPAWTDVAKFIKEQTIAELKAEAQANQKAQQEQKDQYDKNQQEAETQFNKDIDEELAELYSEGKLPRIKDKENPQDPGLVARQALFRTMAEVNIKRIEAKQPPIRSISRIFSNYHKSPNRQPAGADAPIGGGKASTTSETPEDEINYFRDIKGGFRGLYNKVRGK